MKGGHGWIIRGGAAVALGLAVAGCGGRGFPATSEDGRAAPHPTADVHGTRVAALRTADEGPAWLSLFVDAGSRDASPPQVAIVTAMLAAEAAGPRFDARVTPDGTELEGRCPIAELDDCLGALAQALSLRSVDPEALARAHRALSGRRRRAHGDEARRAHHLALRALLGPQTAGTLDPLGDPGEDDAVDTRAAEAFLAAHYGPRRTLLAASGAIQPGEVVDAAKKAFRKLPAATGTRATRPPLVPRTSVAVEVGQRGTLAAAAQVPSASHGRAVIHALLASGLELRLREREPLTVDTHAFDLRGASLVLVRASPLGQLRGATRELAFELGRALLETPPLPRPQPAEPPGTDPARALGQRWLLDGADPPPNRQGAASEPPEGERAELHMGIGAMVPGGRADRTKASDPDALVRRSAEGRLAGVLHASIKALHPTRRGSVHGDGARVVLENGARIDVRRTPRHQRVRIHVRIAGGSSEDPPSLHGRTALHATALSRGCGGHPSDAVRLQLRRLGATLAAEVDGEAFGFVVDAPNHGWREALDLALACVSSPDLSGTALAGARTTLTEALSRARPYRAWAARALAPHTPGLVAPWGATDTLAHVDRPDVLRAHRERVVGARTHLWVQGDIPPPEVVERASRRLARLRPGRLPAAPVSAPPREDPLVLDPTGDPVAIVISWRLEGSRAKERAAAFARQTASALAAEAPSHRPWSDGGGAPWGGWAAVALVAPREAVGPIRERARRLGERLADPQGIDEAHMVEIVLGPASD